MVGIVGTGVVGYWIFIVMYGGVSPVLTTRPLTIIGHGIIIITSMVASTTPSIGVGASTSLKIVWSVEARMSSTLVGGAIPLIRSLSPKPLCRLISRCHDGASSNLASCSARDDRWNLRGICGWRRFLPTKYHS